MFVCQVFRWPNGQFVDRSVGDLTLVGLLVTADPPNNISLAHGSIMQSGSGVKDALAGACIRAPGAASLALALGDPASSQGRLLLVLNLAFQRYACMPSLS